MNLVDEFSIGSILVFETSLFLCIGIDLQNKLFYVIAIDDSEFTGFERWHFSSIKAWIKSDEYYILCSEQ